MHPAKRHVASLALAALLSANALAPATAIGEESTSAESPLAQASKIYRVYNPYSGQHLFTDDNAERNVLVRLGWADEGIGWRAPTSSSTPVYRLFNPYTGEHHYTTSVSERENLRIFGWTYESVAWYSDDDHDVPLYRQFNPYAQVGTHNFTTSPQENDLLASLGWRSEGIAWYGTNQDEYVHHVSDDIYIMGESEASQEDVVAHYERCATYPAATYASKGAGSIESFVSILFDVAQSEGVRADVVYAQAMLETNYLHFGGLVKAEQCNFAGIGAVGQGEPGATFADVRTGLLAHVQHLKAYASSDPLNNSCVDPRFDLVSRGQAPTLYDLGGAWASDKNYGELVANVLLEL